MRLVKKALRGAGLDVVRYSPMRRALDLLAAGSTKRLTFVQIGANNGIDFDEFYACVVSQNMRGIVVEPIRDYFEALEHAYSRWPEIKPVRAAVHPSARQMTMYKVNAEQVTEAWQYGIASFNRAHLIQHGIEDAAIVEEEVDCLDFETILKMLPEGSDLDVLVIDTEGFDAEILKMIDLEKTRPACIRFESAHLPPRERGECEDRLRRCGYNVRFDRRDGLAIRADLKLDWWNYFARV